VDQRDAPRAINALLPIAAVAFGMVLLGVAFDIIRYSVM
jgi:hypothetical protein